MIDTNSYIHEETDINCVAFLTSVKGYKINEIRKKIDEKTGRDIVVFVFYDNHNIINADIIDFLNSDMSRFIQARNSLLSLIRQSKVITKDEFIERANNG
jgi:hypothetical protein